MANFEKVIKVEADTSQAVKSFNELGKVAARSLDQIEKSAKDAASSLEDINKAKADKAAKEFEKLKKAQDAAKASSKAFRDAAVEAAVKVTQAFVTTTGTILSFVSSEEDAAKVTAALAQTMAVADSIEQVYNATKAIGILRSEALAAAETATAAAMVTQAAAAEGAAVATTGLATAMQFLMGPIGIVIASVATLTLLYGAFYRSRLDWAKRFKEIDDAENARENVKLSVAEEVSRKKALLKDDEIERSKFAADEDIKNAEKRTIQAQKELDDEITLFNEKEKAGKLFKRKDRAEAEKLVEEKRALRNKADADELAAEEAKNDLLIDIQKNKDNQLLDLQIEGISSLQDFESKRLVVSLQGQKELNELNARIKKGDSTAEQDKLILAQKISNQLKAIKIEENNFFLNLRNVEADNVLENLSREETASARLREIEINGAKEIDAFNTAIANGEIKTEKEREAILNKTNSARLKFLKTLRDETKLLNQETVNINFDRVIKSLNTSTGDIGKDLTNQLAAIEEVVKKSNTDIEKELADNIAKLGIITTDEQKAQKKAFEDNAEAKKKVVKDNEIETSNIVITQTRLKTEAVLDANQKILESTEQNLEKIKASEKSTFEEQKKAADELLRIKLLRIDLDEQIAVNAANDAKKTNIQIEAIKKDFENLRVAAKDVNKEFNKTTNEINTLFGKSRAEINRTNDAVDQIIKNLDSLANVTAFSTDALLNDVKDVNKEFEQFNNLLKTNEKIGNLNAAAKSLSTLLSLTKEIANGPKISSLVGDEKKDAIANRVAAIGGAIVGITETINNAIQSNIDAQINGIDRQLSILEEKKNDLDEQINESLENIKNLESNLAEAQIEDRGRIIKQIERQRQAEKKLAAEKIKQNELIAQQEAELLEKKKELQKKAFNAQKIASAISIAINTAVGITTAVAQLGPIAGPIAGIAIGALGALQAGIVLSQPTPEFKLGGFTEPGRKDEPAGIVHKGEYVTPKWMVDSPKFSPLIQELETSRQRGFAAGGFESVVNSTNNVADILNKNYEASLLLASRPVVVSVQEIQSVSNSVNRVKVKSTL